jgi:hypothetical protein
MLPPLTAVSPLTAVQDSSEAWHLQASGGR